MGCIYLIRNTVNGKCYIGKTINLKARIKSHFLGYGGSPYLSNAIKKYGKNSFSYETLEEGVHPDLLSAVEMRYISKLNTLYPDGYNLMRYHEGVVVHSEETRRKMSESLKGRKHSEETRQKHSESVKGEKNHNYGKPMSAEQRRKISDSLKGRRIPEDQREKMRGRKKSAATRAKISKARQHPLFDSSKCYFDSLPNSMSLKEKRKSFYKKYPQINYNTAWRWTNKWQSEL